MMCSEPEGECLICGERLSNSSLAPTKLKRHLVNHREYQTKTKEFSFNQTMKGINGDTGLLRTSYRIAEVSCKQKRPFSEGEDVIKPSLIITAEELHGEKAVKRVKEHPLSNDTMLWRANDINLDLKDQLFQKLRATCWFGLQIDESADVSNRAQLLAYVRYPDMESENIIEEYLCYLGVVYIQQAKPFSRS